MTAYEMRISDWISDVCSSDLIVSPDSVHPPADVMRFYGALVEKNAFCFLTGEGDRFVKLEEHVRRLLAVEKLKGELDEKSPVWRERLEEGENAEMQFLGTARGRARKRVVRGRRG